MDEQIKQIAERLRGLRDAMELTPNDISTRTNTNAPSRANTTSP